MNTGILGILLHQLPYQFKGILVLSTIFFLLDLTLFVLVSILLILRLLLYRRQAISELTSDVPTVAFLCCWPIAWLTLVAFVSLTASSASWGGYRFTVLAYVMWWIGAAWMFGMGLGVFFLVIHKKILSTQGIAPPIHIPVVGLATVATIGGLIASFSVDISVGMAIPVIVVSFFTAGVGIFMALILFALLLQHLFVEGLPPPEQAATMFIFVGPMGQSSAALQLLGSAASSYARFGQFEQGTFLTRMAAAPLDVAGVLISMLMTGFSVFWLLFAFIVMIHRAMRKELRWNPTWNAVIFPTGTLTNSMLMFSIEMDSSFFRVITAVLVVFLVLVFFVNLGFTAWEVGKGRLLIVRENPRVKKQLEEQKEQ